MTIFFLLQYFLQEELYFRSDIIEGPQVSLNGVELLERNHRGSEREQKAEYAESHNNLT